MSPNTRVACAVRRAIATSTLVVAATYVATPVQAQDQQDQAEPSQTVVVTGTRIPRIDLETPSPVQVVSRETIEQAGRQSISEVLRGLVSADNQGSIPTAFSAGFAAGSSAVSLRGLGVNSTLVLLNGRRMSTYGLADDGVRTFVDLNSIPLEAVERVEVLKDGGSAIYGSDAVAGVVNIIMRDKYTGVSLGGNLGTSSESDGNLSRIFASAGFGEDRYNVFFVLEGSKEDAIDGRDRGGYLGTSDLRPFGFFDNRQGALAAGFGSFGEGTPAFSSVTPFGAVRTPDPDDGFFDRVNLLPCPEVSADTGVCVFDMIDYFQVQPETRRVNFLGRGTYNINDSGLRAYTELGFFSSKVESIGTPGGLNDSGVFDPANPATPVVHTTVLPADHPDNPTGADRTLSLLTTMLGGRNGKQESEVFRGIFGLSGIAKETWNWDVGLGYIRSELEDTNTGFVRQPVIQEALDNGTFRIDPALNSPELLASISPALKRKPTSSVALVDGSIAGSLWDLGGGPLGVAFGAEYRTEKTDTPPVPFTDTAEIVGLGFSAFNADRDVYAGYVELTAPVIDMLELNAALRYDHYSDFGSSTTPKFGFKFKPLEEFVLRATYAEAFRAPGPAESGNSSSFGFTNIGILTIGNPDVQPEEAKSYTVGIVAQPLDNLSLSLDYYKIERENEIVAADQAVIVGDLPTTGAPNSSIPGLIPNSFLFYDQEGLLGTISAPFINANETNTDGLDLDFRSSFALADNGGELRAGLIWTHIFSFERILPGDVRFEYAGTQGPFVLSSAGGTPDDRGRMELSWERGAWTVTGAVNYVSSMKMIDHEGEELIDLGDGTVATSTFEGAYFNVDPNGPVCGVFNPDGSVPNNCETGSFTTTDLFVRFKGGDAWEVTGSVANLFDKVSPFNPYTYGGHNYNPSFHQAGAVGRFYTLGFRYGF